MLSDAGQLAAMNRARIPDPEERRMQELARQCGLKLIRDRQSHIARTDRRYFLRPLWNARRAVQTRPDGSCELVKIYAGRTPVLGSLQDIEQLLVRWGESAPEHPRFMAGWPELTRRRPANSLA